MAHQTNLEVKTSHKWPLVWRILLVGFLTNLVWENAQAFLYEGYEGFYQHFIMCLIATVVDAVAILALYLIFAGVLQDFYWVRHWNWKSILLIMLAGGLLAILFEKWALSRGEWSYTEAMPVVPFLQVGLSPLLQLTILPVLTFGSATNRVLLQVQNHP